MTTSITYIAWLMFSFLSLMALTGIVWFVVNVRHNEGRRSLRELRLLADSSALWFINPFSRRALRIWRWVGWIVIISWFIVASIIHAGGH